MRTGKKGFEPAEFTGFKLLDHAAHPIVVAMLWVSGITP
jgi:hypothetical protein